MGRRLEREPSLTKLGVASYRERPAYSNEARLVRAIPTILSAVLLAAHFLRDGQIVVIVLCLLLPLLLIPRKLALLRLLQGLLVIGALEWLRTLQTVDPSPLAESGRPWMAWVGGARWADAHVEASARRGFGVDEQALENSTSPD